MSAPIAAVQSDLHIGMRASFERVVEEKDVDAFAAVSGDHNPLHVDDVYAKGTPFGQRVVHGMFLGALVSQLVGMHLPGRDALLLTASLEFKKPVHIGDTVRISGEIIRVSEVTRIAEMQIEIHSNKVLVATGMVRVQVRTV